MLARGATSVQLLARNHVPECFLVTRLSGAPSHPALAPRAPAVVALLQRWYDPAPGCGRVLLDGRDVRSYSPHFLRSLQALVPQMPALWGDSVEYNVAYGSLPDVVPTPDAGVPVDAGPGAAVPGSFRHDPAVEAAARAANAHDFVAAFP